jgi:hypothetical protein
VTVLWPDGSLAVFTNELPDILINFFNRIDLSGKVDVGDLTWEQKERVLRYLFAKMNGAKDKQKYPALPPIQPKQAKNIDQGEG